MLAEIGLFCLIASCASALCGAGLSFWGLFNKEPFTRGFYRPGLAAASLCILISSLCLWSCLLGDDFSVRYVAYNSNSLLALPYKFAAFWAGHEGSLLLWIGLAALFGAFSLIAAPAEESFRACFVSTLLLVLGALTLFSIAESNAFLRLLPDVPADGRDLNPILQDIGMIVHPPLLFAGYSSLILAFCATSSMLLTGQTGEKELTFLRTLARASWVFLTAGNALGSWWAYTELGWGGWWFWDPVENSSFVPWLTSCALLHVLTCRRPNLKFAVLLSLAGFLLCLIGMFLVRSGIVQSVHAFASDKERATALFILCLVLAAPAVTLTALKIKPLCRVQTADNNFSPVSAGVYLICAAAVSVLFGTLYPVVFEAFTDRSLSVGAPYFNGFFAPMVILCAVLVGWIQLSGTSRNAKIFLAVLSLAAGVLVSLILSPKNPVLTALGFAGASWIILSAATHLRARRLSCAALIAHLGLALCMIGATGVSNFESDALVRMGPGLGKPVSNRIFVYDETRDVETRSFRAKEAQILVMDEAENVLGVLRPQRQVFRTNGMQMTAAGIHHGLLRDLYVSMGNELQDGQYLVRISIKPLISWLWIGALVMLLTVFVFAFSCRKRRALP